MAADHLKKIDRPVTLLPKINLQFEICNFEIDCTPLVPPLKALAFAPQSPLPGR
jgi:hypothetical protein